MGISAKSDEDKREKERGVLALQEGGRIDSSPKGRWCRYREWVFRLWPSLASSQRSISFDNRLAPEYLPRSICLSVYAACAGVHIFANVGVYVRMMVFAR